MFFQYQNRNWFFLLIIILILLCCACNKPYPRNKGCCDCNDDPCCGPDWDEKPPVKPPVKPEIKPSANSNCCMEGYTYVKVNDCDCVEEDIWESPTIECFEKPCFENTMGNNPHTIESNPHINEINKSTIRCEDTSTSRGSEILYGNIIRSVSIEDDIQENYMDNLGINNNILFKNNIGNQGIGKEITSDNVIEEYKISEQPMYGNVIRIPSEYNTREENINNTHNLLNNNGIDSDEILEEIEMFKKHGGKQRKSSKRRSGKYEAAMKMINTALDEKNNLTMYINAQIQNTMKAIDSVKQSDNIDLNSMDIQEIKGEMNRKLKEIERQEELIMIKLKKGRDILKKNGYM